MESGRREWPPQWVQSKAILRNLDNCLLEEPGYIFIDSYFVASNIAISSTTWKTKTGRLKRLLKKKEKEKRPLLWAENYRNEIIAADQVLGHSGNVQIKHLLPDETD